MIDYGLMVLLTSVFSVNYLVSATISFIVSVVFNYIASMRYVFHHRDGLSRRREFLIFVTLSVIGLLINDGLMYLGTSILGIDYRISKLGAAVVVSLWNFFTRKAFLDSKDPELEEEALAQDLAYLEREVDSTHHR